MGMSYHDDIASIHRDFRCTDQMFRGIHRNIIISQWLLAATLAIQLGILVMLP